MRFTISLGLFVFSLAFGACADSGGYVDVGEYNTTCTADADCGLVFSGDVCACSCTEGAVNVSDLAKFHQAVTEAAQGCSNELLCGACQETKKAVCQKGVCAAVAK